MRRTLTPANDVDADPGERTRLRTLLGAALGVIIVGGTIDLVLDRPASPWSAHVLFEVGMITAALAIAVVLWTGWWRAERSVRDLKRSLSEREAERDLWRAGAERAVEEFGRAIERQFTQWGLTPTEREIAFRLLEGHGHKQIAARTGRSERTVRQHAVAIYEKSGLAGRAELSAFFLGGLIPRASSTELPTPNA